MTREDDVTENQLRQLEQVSKFVRPRLLRAECAYNQALTSLWLGNGGAAVAVLSFIGAAWHKGTSPSHLLWPLWCFVLGLISMGVGAVMALVKEANAVRSMERATTVWQFLVDDHKSGTEQAGLTLGDWRTRMAIGSAALFILGCLIGLAELSISN